MKIIAALILAAAVAGAGYYFYFRDDAPPQGAGGGPPPGFATPVEAEEVTVESFARTVPAVGTLRSSESLVVRPEIAGRIEEIRFDEGQPVEKGDVLVTLDDRIARAELAEARSSLTLSRQTFQRASRLLRDKVGTEKTRDEAQAALRADEARVAVAEQRLAKTTITAPFAGITGFRRVSPGEYVTVGQDIVSLDQIDVLKADFRVAELELPRLEMGQTVRVTVDALPGRTFTGEVYAIDPAVDPEGRSIALRARIGNPDRLLRPGLFARISLETARFDNAILIPEQAVIPMGEDSFVFRITDGKAQRVKIDTGERRPGMVHVTAGLSPGDRVITAGQIKLQDGAPVQAVNGQAADSQGTGQKGQPQDGGEHGAGQDGAPATREAPADGGGDGAGKAQP